jgi:hypothetical protein
MACLPTYRLSIVFPFDITLFNAETEMPSASATSVQSMFEVAPALFTISTFLEFKVAYFYAVFYVVTILTICSVSTGNSLFT